MTVRAFVAIVASPLLLVGASPSGAPASVSAATCRQWAASPAFASQIAAVRGLVPKMQRAFAAPGLSVAIAANGRLVWSESCGFADRAKRTPVTRTTQFRVGSVSKPFTAAIALRLAQQGRLDLDADIRRYVPAFPSARPRVTARKLGGHLGGIRHYQGGAEAVNRTHYRSLADSLKVFIDDPLVAEPGTRFSYSSYGFNLLGAAVESAASVPFVRAVQQTLLGPLRLRRTTVGGRAQGGTRFYEITNARRAAPAPPIDLSDRYPSGGFLSSAEDLVRLGLGVTDRRFLSVASQRLLFTSQRTTGGAATGYGFGLEVHPSPFGVVAGHTGNVVGGTSFLLIHPKTRVVVALTSNIGFVTASQPPDLAGTPDPPLLAVPFVRRVLQRR
jgi:serine beta-lactamase-like protein LACTB, mitochondrial